MHTYDMLGLSSIPSKLTEIISTVEGATVESPDWNSVIELSVAKWAPLTVHYITQTVRVIRG